MKWITPCAKVGALISFVLIFAQSIFGAKSTSELHQLYRSGQYFECYKAATEAASASRKQAVPRFYAAISLARFEKDSEMRRNVRQPYAEALRLLEEARNLDPSGTQLKAYRKGLFFIQQTIFEKAKAAWQKGNPKVRKYFDWIAKIFNKRTGTWKSLYHFGRDSWNPDYDFSAWDNPYYRLANTARDVKGLSDEVKNMIYLHNLCRANPQLFRDTFLKKYMEIRGMGPRDNHFIASLIKDLGSTKPTGFLYADQKLLKASRYHARDLAISKTFGHSSSDGTSFSRRLDRYAPEYGSCAENCAAGYAYVMSCFMELLIDEGVESLGHRYNILGSGYDKIGVGVEDRPNTWKIWVFDFAG